MKLLVACTIVWVELHDSNTLNLGCIACVPAICMWEDQLV